MRHLPPSVSGWDDAQRALTVAAAVAGDRPSHEVRSAISTTFDGFGSGWADAHRVAVVAAAAAGTRPVHELRDAMSEAFAGFGSGWSDGYRVRVVQAAVGGRNGTSTVEHLRAALEVMSAPAVAATAAA